MIPSEARAAMQQAMGERVQFDAPMSRHTSLCIGGPADALATPASREELGALLRTCARYSLPHSVVGAGFNVLVSDAGIDGVVIVLKKLRAIDRGEGPSLFIEAGASHAQITRFCVKEGLAGLEFGAGIPGTLGGWVAMNAGIGSRELKDVVLEIVIVSPDGEHEETFPREDLDFRYRDLHGLPEGSLVVAARLAVSEATSEAVQSTIDTLLARRSASQPLNVPSCGSVFRNPPGDFAGRLIEAAGLKGDSIGAAQISPVHANFIANTGGATAADVLALIQRARARVFETSGIELETEVQLVGREKS